MATLGAVSDRIKAKKASHQAKADGWAAELDKMDKVEPELFAAGDAAIAERSADMAELRDNFKDMRSNLGPTSGGLSSEPAITPTPPAGELRPPEAPGLPKAPQLAPAATPSPAQGVPAKAPFR